MMVTDIGATLESGQFFRWRRQGERYVIVSHRTIFTAADGPRFQGRATLARRFFSLDHDLDRILEPYRRDRHLRRAIDAYPGLRILRQDPWECLVAFVTSIASNIPRITRNLADLCRELGPCVSLNGTGDAATPAPERLTDGRLLRRLGFGFRARYLVPLARQVERGALDVDRLPTAEARARLCELPGVAEKVADCVLLFSFERLEAFPVDTWIRRVMTDLYFAGRRPRGGDRAIRAFAADRFGAHAGYAQQYLYHWSRNR